MDVDADLEEALARMRRMAVVRVERDRTKTVAVVCFYSWDAESDSVWLTLSSSVRDAKPATELTGNLLREVTG